MNREQSYQRQESAGRMEAVLLLVSGIGFIGAIFAFASGGWFPCLTLLILSSLAFGLSRLLDLVSDLLKASEKPIGSDQQQSQTSQTNAS